MTTKAERHEAIRERARDAIRDLYHNATPHYPALEGEAANEFQGWFEGAAEFEIEYLQDGGAYGCNFRRTLQLNAERKYTSEAARAYYVRKGMRDMRRERARCNRLDSRKAGTDAQWERITEFGTLYQWGRGGRTLAPDRLISTGGGSSFCVREDYPDDLPIADCVDLIRIVESFNRYAASWCADVPEQWAEYWAEVMDMHNEEAARATEETRPDMHAPA